MPFTSVGDYRTGAGRKGVTFRWNRMFVWAKHETGLISSTTVPGRDKKARERKKSSKTRGGKSDPLTIEDWWQKKGGQEIISQGLSSTESFCNDTEHT